MNESIKRISIMIGKEQHRRIQDSGLNTSGLIRSLIDDHFSDHKITLSVNRKTYQLYQEIVSNTGSTDDDIEPHFVEALKKVLKEKLKKIEALQKSVENS